MADSEDQNTVRDEDRKTSANEVSVGSEYSVGYWTTGSPSYTRRKFACIFVYACVFGVRVCSDQRLLWVSSVSFILLRQGISLNLELANLASVQFSGYLDTLCLCLS